MKKLFLLSMMCFMAFVMNAQSFVDLGLPSGTKWKAENQKGLNSYDDAMAKYGNRIPTKAQWEELDIECTWEWTGSGYKVTGPNGNSIELPAEGFRDCDWSARCVGSDGGYWSSTPSGSGYAWYLGFNSSGVGMYSSYRCYGRSVRLVQD